MDLPVQTPDHPCPTANTPYSAVYGGLYDRFPQEARRNPASDMTLLQVDQTSHETIDPPVEDVVLRLVTRGPLSHSAVDYGDGYRKLSGRKGSFYLARAMAEASWEGAGDHRLLLFAIPRTRLDGLVQTVDDRQGDPLDALYGRDVQDPLVADLMARMWAVSATPGPGSGLMLDGLLMTMIGVLLNHAVDGGSPEDPCDGVPALDAARLDRVTDYVDANLDRPIRIADLADVACLSPYHFCRRFRAATGVSPYAFVTRRRVEAGCTLLAQPDRSLAEIAYACGFSSQAHFSNQFKALMGRPPGRYRADLLA